MLEDANTALGVVEPLAKFGSSAFGPVQARAISANGVAGDWLSLGTLVRIPDFKELRCPRSVSHPCVLMGTNLFLAESVASSSDFENAVDVPADFTGTQLTVPHPANGVLYLKLRDDPSTVQTLALSVMPWTTGTPVPTAIKPAAAAPVSTAPADTTPTSTAPATTAPAPAPEQQNAQTPAPPPSKKER